jgi:hypothetical protein
MFPKLKTYIIECRTGCSCCSDENHYRGFYKTRGDAERRVKAFLAPGSRCYPLASQFSRQGSYGVKEVEIEQLPDDRVILYGRVIDCSHMLEVSEDGSTVTPDYERLDDLYGL